MIPRQTRHFCKSMSPLLCQGDILDISPCLKHPVFRGDIVLFKNRKGIWIAHRIFAIKNGRIFTRGDNNDRPDGRWLPRAEIGGLVTGRWRKGRYLKVYGGRRGLLQCYFFLIYFNVRTVLNTKMSAVTAPFFLEVLFNTVFPHPKEICFKKESGTSRLLYLGKIHIGTFSERKKCWNIRFPYRLFIQDSS